MAKEWYYMKNGATHGPITGTKLKLLALAGRLLPTDLVRKEGMSGWKAAKKVQGLFAGAKLTAPPPQPAKHALQLPEPEAASTRRKTTEASAGSVQGQPAETKEELAGAEGFGFNLDDGPALVHHRDTTERDNGTTTQRRLLLVGLSAACVGLVGGLVVGVVVGGRNDRGDVLTKEQSQSDREDGLTKEQLQLLESSRVSRAKIDCQSLGSQVETFKLNNNRYPNSMEELTQTQPNGEPPLVEPDRLKDPWGKTYQIDTKRPAGSEARVFTVTPWGETVSN
jgi:hypothetical protein